MCRPARDEIEYKRGFIARGIHKGNEKRRWYGTIRECTIGNSADDTKPCGSDACELCKILRESYDVEQSPMGM